MPIYDENGNIIGLEPFNPIPQYTRPFNFNAEDIILGGWDSSQAYSSTAFNASMNFLGEIANISGQLTALPDINADVALASTTLTPIEIPAAPARPDGLEMNLPAPPTEPTLDVVASLDLGNAPELTAAAPDIDLSIAAPAPFAESLPAAPGLETVTLPEAVAFDMPVTPAMLPVEVPGVPALNLPVFDAAVPEFTVPAPDIGTFSFVEERYTSELLTSLRAMLQRWVDGAATGLDPDVERAIWNRARERENALTLRKTREVLRQFASRGFSQPPGALSIALSDAAQEAQNKDSELSREIMVKQAELEQSNRRFAFEQAWQVESGLISYASQIAQRAFEASKFALTIALEVFQAQVAQYDAQVKAFGVRAEAFRAQLQAELAHLEVFRAQIEGQKLIGELNAQLVETYKAQIEAAKARVDVYRTQVEAARVISEVNRTTIEAYAARIGAYESLVKAKAAEYDGYATRVKAEVSKVEVFKAQADAYRSQVEGFRSLVEAKAAEKNVELKIKQEAPIDLFKARTEAFRTQAGAEAERVRAVAGVHQAEVEAFSATVRAQAARADAEATIYRAESDVNVASAQVRIEAAKATIAKLTSQVEILSQNVRAGAQVAAQLAAAALSQFNYSSGTSVSESVSTSDSNVNTNSDSNSFNISIIKTID
ncbi:hypothetical protein [Aromatoleum anaerobium]|uniref:Uncharacterized protein n=2 Tax=Aromatoleum TaxID=551759 RepID=A0ABX1PNU0_9RHOO|nr:hypothetical protein [Aromatoleum anaerobium]MCK0507893.1 hypothetical protein [Aromatoleum anaerobium]